MPLAPLSKNLFKAAIMIQKGGGAAALSAADVGSSVGLHKLTAAASPTSVLTSDAAGVYKFSK